MRRLTKSKFSNKAFKPMFLGLLLVLTLFLGFVPQAQAIEVYRFLDDQCQGETGLIIGVDGKKIKLITLDGKFKELPKSNLQHILVYYALENPIGQVDFSGITKELPMDVYTKDLDAPSFTGWAVSFIEEQVVFFTTEGSLSLVSVDKIQQISTVKTAFSIQKLGNYKKRKFVLVQGFPSCKPELAQADDLRPLRIMGDHIQINKFLKGYEDGFKDLNRFQTRTQFYAKPYLFPKETRLGLPLTTKAVNAELPSLFPFYFQWSSGKPYSHQAVTAIGTKENSNLPLLEPTFAIQADFKSHFFNASYVGNPWAMAAGSDFLTENRFLFTDYYTKITNQPVFLLPHYNYMALSGVDYGPYSLSGGVYYPIYALHGGGIFREVTSNRASPILRFIYNRGSNKFKVIYSNFSNSGGTPKVEQMRLFPSSELVSGGIASGAESALRANLSSYSLKVDFLRFGVENQWNDEITWGLDGLLILGDYSETYSGRAQSLQSTQKSIAGFIAQKFGSYIRLQGQLNLYSRDYIYDFNNYSDSYKNQEYSLMGSIEFFF
ncbi:MAG: hypothetical protein QNL04_02135 [SAR324 cluster bacterium]|nr:hypothetical protein [SAR324 cluster bacterium]